MAFSDPQGSYRLDVFVLRLWNHLHFLITTQDALLQISNFIFILDLMYIYILSESGFFSLLQFLRP